MTRQQLPAIRTSVPQALELEGGRGAWWRQGMQSWQPLATCFELDEVRASGIPEATGGTTASAQKHMSASCPFRIRRLWR